MIGIAIKNNKIMNKKFIIITHKTTQKYIGFFSMNNGVKWIYLNILNNFSINLSCCQIGQNYTLLYKLKTLIFLIILTVLSNINAINCR